MCGAADSPRWTWIAPLAGWAVMLAAWLLGTRGSISLAAVLALPVVVFAAVHHAEVVAHRVGEPFGTLVLAVAVTVIEVALIVSVMLADPIAKTGLARDTVFAAVMIVCNGIVGLCLLVGGVRHHEQGFHVQGASAALAVLTALVTMTLVLPNYTVSASGPAYTGVQLAFAATVSLILYLAFVFVQTVRHRDYFLPVDVPGDEEVHADPPSTNAALMSLGWLLAALIAVVGLAKTLTPAIELMIAQANAPKSLVGIVIAGLVLMPEGMAAVRSARANRLQTSLNLALGSALATIGLTIPTVAAVSIILNLPLLLGLGNVEQVLLALTLVLSIITLGTGWTTMLQGIIHLVIFAAFVLFAVVP